MTQLADQDIQIVSQAISPSSEELYSIRIEVVAQQPQPNIRDVVYVGLSGLIPTDLQALCSCAGLFFARVCALRASGDLYQIKVAALAHYFDAPCKTRDRHVRVIVLPAVDFVQLLEWDRSLAGKATCDVRELVEEHVATIKQLQQVQAPVNVSVATDSVLENKSKHQPVADAHPQGDASKGGNAPNPGGVDVDQVEYEAERECVIIPLDVMCEIDSCAAPYRPSRVRVSRLVLQAALQQLRSEHQAEKSKKQQSALKQKERRIRRVYQMQDQVPMHRLVEITPIYGRGMSGEIVACRVDVDVPVAA